MSSVSSYTVFDNVIKELIALDKFDKVECKPNFGL